MFQDEEYIRAGAHLAYSQQEVIHRSEVVVKVAAPTVEELAHFPKSAAVLAFHHLAVQARPLPRNFCMTA